MLRKLINKWYWKSQRVLFHTKVRSYMIPSIFSLQYFNVYVHSPLCSRCSHFKTGCHMVSQSRIFSVKIYLIPQINQYHYKWLTAQTTFFVRPFYQLTVQYWFFSWIGGSTLGFASQLTRLSSNHTVRLANKLGIVRPASYFWENVLT